MSYSLTYIPGLPVPLFVASLAADESPDKPDIEPWALVDAAAALAPGSVDAVTLFSCGFRATSMDRLSVVLATGIDVEPPDAPIFVDYLDKAVEYGGWPKLVMALRRESLDRTFRVVAADTPEEELALLRLTFTTQVPDPVGDEMWLSRLPLGHSRLASPYEMAYGYWIPGDAREALVAVFVLQHPSGGPLAAIAPRVAGAHDGDACGLEKTA